jgi:mannose-6-phosphate isomerase-like protein (cupin superfamily)
MIMIMLSSALAVTAQETKALDNEDYWVEWALAGSDLNGDPWRPGIDADTDLFINSWDGAPVKVTHGTLHERDILTSGDPINPPRKGAVLKHASGFTHATLAMGTSTVETTLRGKQEVLYILTGEGTITAGSKTAELTSGIVVLIPEGRSFIITNTTDEALTFYIIHDPVPDGFKPNKDILVKDENRIPVNEVGYHWTHIAKMVLLPSDGLATVHYVQTVEQPPMTIGHPHSHNEDFEEVWTAIRGTSLVFLGKKIRNQPPGTAYMIPPDDKTPHCNINLTDEPAKLLYFSTRFDL